MTTQPEEHPRNLIELANAYPRKGGDEEKFTRNYFKLRDRGWTHKRIMDQVSLLTLKSIDKESSELPMCDEFLGMLIGDPAKLFATLNLPEPTDDDPHTLMRKHSWASDLMSCGIPSRFKSASVDDFGKSVTELIPDKPVDILVVGSETGVGKTHLGCAIASKWKWDNRDLSVRWASVPDVLGELRASFNSPKVTESDIISRYSKSNVLVLDDLGAEQTTDWAVASLYRLIDKRYRDVSPTVITSNLTLDEINDISARIASRIGGYDLVVLGGSDRRLEEHNVTA